MQGSVTTCWRLHMGSLILFSEDFLLKFLEEKVKNKWAFRYDCDASQCFQSAPLLHVKHEPSGIFLDTIWLGFALCLYSHLSVIFCVLNSVHCFSNPFCLHLSCCCDRMTQARAASIPVAWSNEMRYPKAEYIVFLCKMFESTCLFCLYLNWLLFVVLSSHLSICLFMFFSCFPPFILFSPLFICLNFLPRPIKFPSSGLWVKEAPIPTC